jgi:hypothetical protein
METLEPFAINNPPRSTFGPWGAGWRRERGGDLVQLCAPIFHRRQTAEIFCEAVPHLGITDEPAAEKRIAKQIEKFIDEWDEANEQDDGTFPTHDGRYPSTRKMGEYFVEWYKRNHRKEAA